MDIKIIENLHSIKLWIENSPPLDSLNSNDDFMVLIVKAMNKCLYLIKVSLLMVTEQELKAGFTTEKAIIVGHMVRVYKLYEGFLYHISQHQLEIAMVFLRLIFEATSRMKYLIRNSNNEETFSSFILTSYRSEKEVLDDLNRKAQSRPLIEIESRIMRSIKYHLGDDKITEEALAANKNWKIDGKSARDLLASMGEEALYPYLYASSSHYVHGDWHDIKQYHLQEKDGFIHPKLDYSIPDPRPTIAASRIVLRAAVKFLEFRNTDPSRAVVTLLDHMEEFLGAVDKRHEQLL